MSELEKLKAELAEVRRQYQELLDRHILQMWATSELLIARRKTAGVELH